MERIFFALCLLLLYSVQAQINTENGISRVSTVKYGHIVIWNGASWERRFLTGMNIGASLPGHFPGEFAVTRELYLEWFQDCVDLDVDVIRIYTLHPPYFYSALAEFNRGRTRPLYLFQGVWSPEEELINGGNGTDAWNETITSLFAENIREVVRAIHGDIFIAERVGSAYGSFAVDVSEYVIGWIVGTEWFQETVVSTNRIPTMMTRDYQYIAPTPQASRFERWVAYMLDYAASVDMEYRWQRPISFTNWITTDPIIHPLEPDPDVEDLASVDVAHMGPTSNWTGGYFGAFHIYPYYPDSVRIEYDQCLNCRGQVDPYAGYIHQLKSYYADIPLIVAEFGLPTSRSLTHIAPFGRHQGGHNETEQGRMIADMMHIIYEEDYDAGLIFEIVDELFKISWNTMEFERNGYEWRNRLTNEEHFGIIAMDPGWSYNEGMYLDGREDDWIRRENSPNATRVFTYHNEEFTWKITHDESDLYLLIEKNSGAWSFPQESILIGFDVVPGGYNCPGGTFNTPVEEFLVLSGIDNSLMYVNTKYDLFYAFKHFPRPYETELFEPNKILVSQMMIVPQCEFPAEVLVTGSWRFGISNPASPEFTNLADWYYDGNILEVRFPWFLLGIMDPSTKLALDYFTGDLPSYRTIDGISLEIVHRSQYGTTRTAPSFYNWEGWTVPSWHQRRKQSFEIIASMNRLIHSSTVDPQCVPRSPCQAQSLTECIETSLPNLIRTRGFDSIPREDICLNMHSSTYDGIPTNFYWPIPHP